MLNVAPSMFRKPHRFIQLAALLVAVLGLSACSSLKVNNPWSQAPQPDPSLIASNLVNSLAQVPHLNAKTATIQIAKPKDAFGRAVRDEFSELGFNIENVTGNKGMQRVRTDLKRVTSETGEQQVYIVSVGPVSVERAFALLEGKTVPQSEQVIRGTDARAIVLNDQVFESMDSSLTAVAFRPYEGPRIDDVIAAPVPKTRTASFWRRDKQNAVKKNLYETLTSNYKDVFSGYVDVDQSILVFPNDSLRLGTTNKEIIEHYVSQMNPETDLLSIIGCSHGETEINNGNSLLAIGRANRVKEALLFSGLEHDQILEEGCWAPVTFDEVMPRRGVVLTLKRQKNS